MTRTSLPSPVLLFLLCLVSTQPIESVRVGTALRPTTFNVSNDTAEEHRAQDDSIFSFAQSYRVVGIYTFVIMLAVTYLTMRASFAALQTHKTCRTGKPDPAFSGIQVDAWKNFPMSIETYAPILVQRGEDSVNMPWTAIPYMAQTRNESGFIGILLQARDWQGEPLFPRNSSTYMIISAECQEFDERDPDSVGWMNMGLEEWLLTDEVHAGTVRGVFKDPEQRWLMSYRLQVNLMLKRPESQFKWCPGPSRLEVRPQDVVCDDWNFPTPVADSIRAIEYVKNLARLRVNLDDDEVTPTTEGRDEFNIYAKDKFWPKMWMYIAYTFFSVWLYLVTYATLYRMSGRDDLDRSLTPELLGDVDGVRGGINRQRPKVEDPYTAGLYIHESSLMWLKEMLSGNRLGFTLLMPTLLLVVVIILFAAIAKLFYIRRFRLWYIRGQHLGKMKIQYDRLAMYMGAVRQIVIVSLCMLGPLLQWVFFKSETWAVGKRLTEVRIVITWLNYFMGLVYFAHVLTQYLSGWMNVPMTPMLDDDTANLMLGVLAAVTGLLDLAELARDSHGWGRSCTFANLGYTFRTIARETPESFPNGSKVQLFCTESMLSFEQVLSITTETVWKDLEDAVLHDGETCNLVCTLHQPDGETDTTSYPISCQNPGMASSRWSLSANSERFGNDRSRRLCPMPKTNSTGNNSRAYTYDPFAADDSAIIRTEDNSNSILGRLGDAVAKLLAVAAPQR